MPYSSLPDIALRDRSTALPPIGVALLKAWKAKIPFGDEDAAEDYSSQCLILALESMAEGRLREPSALAGYVWGIHRNLLRNAIAAKIAHGMRHSDQMIELIPGIR